MLGLESLWVFSLHLPFAAFPIIVVLVWIELGSLSSMFSKLTPTRSLPNLRFLLPSRALTFPFGAWRATSHAIVGTKEFWCRMNGLTHLFLFFSKVDFYLQTLKGLARSSQHKTHSGLEAGKPHRSVHFSMYFRLLLQLLLW